MTDEPSASLLDASEAEAIGLALALALGDTPEAAAHVLANMDRTGLDRLATAAEQLATRIRSVLDIPQPGTPEAGRQDAVDRLTLAAAKLVKTASPRPVGGPVVGEHALARLTVALDDVSPGLVGRLA